MTTRAAQIEILAAGMLYNGSPISNPYAKFYAAGTTTAKNAWADKEKAVAFTKLALDAQGRGVAFGDGIYKIRIYAGDPDAAAPLTGVLKIEIDNYKVQAPVGAVRTITADDAGTSDDYCILGNTSGGNVAYTLPDAATMPGATIYAKKIHANNTFTVAAYAGQNIDGSASLALSDLNETVQLISDGTNWRGVELVAAAGGAETLNGYTADPGQVAGTIPVRDGSAKIPGGCTGRADLNTSDLTTHKTSSDHDGRYFTETEIGTLHYTKTNLQTSGQASVHSGNLTNKTSISHSQITDDEATKHRLISDGGESSTVLWSGGYIDSRLDLKADQSNTYTKAEVNAAISAAIVGHTHPIPGGGDTGGGAE